MLIRHAAPADYAPVIAVIDEWWGGRHMADMVPRLFFTKFRPTSFVGEHEGEVRAFLCGFVSETDPADAYVHFVGVHPDERGTGLGRRLYERFFAEVAALGCTRVGCVTGPVNTGSRAFHASMGFTERIVPDYDGAGDDRVVFEKFLPTLGVHRPDAELAGIHLAHRRLLATLERDAWEPSTPSLLPGWSIGHLLTHIARNADGIAGLFAAAARGEEGFQYPGGAEQRSADIEAGAGRGRAELLDDVRRSAAEVEYRAALVPDDAWSTGVGHSVFGPSPLTEWPLRRRREIEIHHADLGLSFTPDDWSAPFVDREWAEQVDELAERLPDDGPTERGVRLDPVDAPEHAVDVGGGGAPITALRRDLLAWMLGRTTIDGAPELRSPG